MINREQKRQIPGRHSIILAKVSELSNGKFPIEALQELYYKSTETQRSDMIAHFLVEIKAECEIENIKKVG